MSINHKPFLSNKYVCAECKNFVTHHINWETNQVSCSSCKCISQMNPDLSKTKIQPIKNVRW